MSSSLRVLLVFAGSAALWSGDFDVRRAAPNSLTIGADCVPSSPCNVRFGNHVYSFVQGGTATAPGGGGTAWIYISSSGRLAVGSNFSVRCANGCEAVSGITSFPADSIPLFTWQASNGSWLEHGDDKRAPLSTKPVGGGTGLMAESDSSGATTIRVDTTVVGLRAAVPASSSFSCAAGAWAVDDSYYYVCVAPNKWKRLAWSAW